MEAQQQAQPQESKEERTKPTEAEAIYATSLPSSGALAETILSPQGPVFFIRKKSGEATFATEFRYNGDLYRPLQKKHLAWSKVILPGEPRPYGSVEALTEKTLDFLVENCQVPASRLPLIPLFVRATWLAERSRTAPFLRFSGVPGSGKSTTAKTTARMCMKPYITNGSTTSASLFRNMDRIGVCTTLLDENEFADDNDMQKSITRIAKIGFDMDGEVERCSESKSAEDKGQRVDRFRVGGPKIFAAIEHDPDIALRSRCISIAMVESPRVPVEPGPEYEARIEELQAMYLQYRVDNWFADLREPTRLPIKPRLLQLYWPLAKVALESELALLDELFIEMNEELVEEMGQTAEARVGRNLRVWMTTHPDEQPIFFTDLAEAPDAPERDSGKGSELTARAVGDVVRKLLRLKLKKHRDTGRMMIVSPWDEIGRKLEEYGW